MTYLSHRPLGLDPGLLPSYQANILTKIKEGNYAAAQDRYEVLSQDEKLSVLLYLKAARDRGEITNDQLEKFAKGESVLEMPAEVIKSWFERNKVAVLVGTALGIGALWYFSRSKKKKRGS